MKVLIAAFALVAFVACSSGTDDATPTAAPATASHAGHGGSSDIVMELIAYKPDKLEVPVGTKVTWTQKDAGFHTVTSGTAEVDSSGAIETNPDGEFASGQLAKDKTFSHAFDQAGTFKYFCEIHPATMSGQVVAQ